MRFYATAFSLVIGRLERAWHALNVAAMPIEHPPRWSAEAAWKEVDEALAAAQGVLSEHQFPQELLRQLERTVNRCELRTRANMSLAIGAIQELAASITDVMAGRAYVMITPGEKDSFDKPLERFGGAAAKFISANHSMQATSRCYGLEEWDAAVFHAMGVLEHGLRWLAAQFPNLTLTKPVELENWENIVNNIQARIDEELKRNAPRTEQRDEDLAFYGKVASEFRYFKDAWRNHVMHNRYDPYDAGMAQSVIGHVATFMKVLAERA